MSAFRLRTLPLSLAAVLMGGFVAKSLGFENLTILSLAVLTTLFLQILSNLANDLGDYLKGTDNDKRLGPQRTMQKGAISVNHMKIAIAIGIALSFISGLLLIYFSFGVEKYLQAATFLVVGLVAIWAAVKYTLGKSAYGYSGYGDVFVFLFFGWVAVAGTFYLMAQQVFPIVFLPASTLGLFSAGVLNVNNLRDHENDRSNNKSTLIVKMGFDKGKGYHVALIASGWMLFAVYLLMFGKPSGWLVLVSLPLFILHGFRVIQTSHPQNLDPELKKLALSIAFFSVLFGIGVYV